HYLDCRNTTKWQLLLAKTGVNELTGVEIMKLLVEMQAIDKDLWESKLIWCQKLVDNVSDVYKNRRREIPQKPVITKEKALTTGGKAIITGENPQSKVKYSKVNKSIYIPYSEYPNVNKITKEEHQKLIEKFGEAGAKDRVENLSLYIASKGDKYKNHYATILAWEKQDKKEKGGPHADRREPGDEGGPEAPQRDIIAEARAGGWEVVGEDEPEPTEARNKG
ncbi:unnamed protein product, partial [marine sediment metagenome]